MAFWQAKNRTVRTNQIVDQSPTGRTSKDDGGEARGADREFEALSAGQFSGDTTVTINSIDDVHTNACVLDKRTGLMWNKEWTPLAYGSGAEGLLWDATGEAAGLDEEDIFGYVDAANIAGLSGFSDWRVPNVFEMYTLCVNDSVGAFKPDTTYFPTQPGGNYNTWTSTSRHNDISKALYVSANVGGIGSNTKTTTHLQCMLVRG